MRFVRFVLGKKVANGKRSARPSQVRTERPFPKAEARELKTEASVGSETVEIQSTRRLSQVVLAVILVLATGIVLVVSPLGKVFTGEEATAAGSANTAAIAQGAPACGAEQPPAHKALTLARADKVLKPGRDYSATVYTSCGDFKIDLLETTAPKAVNNFVFLAQKGFYQGLIWHQVSYDFLIQTGDPNGQNGVAPDDAGYTIPDELPKTAKEYKYGAVGFANRGAPNTAGSQFFVVVHDLQGALQGSGKYLQIEPSYTVFGKINKKFFGSVENIARQPVRGGEDPLTASQPASPVYIESIEISAKRV